MSLANLTEEVVNNLKEKKSTITGGFEDSGRSSTTGSGATFFTTGVTGTITVTDNIGLAPGVATFVNIHNPNITEESIVLSDVFDLQSGQLELGRAVIKVQSVDLGLTVVSITNPAASGANLSFNGFKLYFVIL